jgi:hypothetical protein
MKPRDWKAGLIVLAVAVAGPAAGAAEPAGVNQAIDRGVAYLKGLQRPDGTWPRDEVGATALAGLALLECRVPADDPAVRKAADVVRAAAVSLTHTYSISLSLLFLDRLGDPDDVPLIESLGVRLLAGQNSVGGWDYSCPAIPEAERQRLTSLLARRAASAARQAPAEPVRTGRTERELPGEIREQLRLLDQQAARQATEKPGRDDNSNTHFATLALWVARRHGLPIERAVTLLYRRFRVSQNPENGGWGYSFSAPDAKGKVHEKSTAPMTCAGLIGLAVAHGVARDVAAAAADSRPPREPTKDPAIRAGLFALGTAIGHPVGDRKNRQVPVLPPGGKDYYFLWAVERVATAYGLETIGKKDWYAWGAEVLVANQQADGSWPGEYAAGGVDTCFALLFLRRANLARDLTATLRGRVPDPGAVELRAGGVGGDALPTPLRKALPVKDPEPQRARGTTPVARLSDGLVTAAPERQAELLAFYQQEKGAIYTEALAAAIPRLTGPVRTKARDALADRLARMSSRTLGDRLRDDNPEVRRAAALACCMKDDRGHVPRLIELLEDPEPAVPRAAYAALKGLSGQDFGPGVQAGPAELARAVAAWRAWWAGQAGR